MLCFTVNGNRSVRAFAARWLRPASIACAATMGSVSISALAADGRDQQGSELSEVVVSAARNGDQSLQTIPISVTALDPQTLALKGGASLTDLARDVPSLTVTERAPGQNQITLRGLTTGLVDIYNSTEERPLVAMYLDDTSLAMAGFTPDLKTYELERIEVLRGPQGTLYGASSMSGTIRFITKKPSTNEFSGSAEVLGSSTENGGGNYSAKATVNIPLADNLAGLTIGAYNGRNSGYIDNIGNGDRDSNWDRTTQVRTALRVIPSDLLTIDASLFYSKLDAGGGNLVFPALGRHTFSSLTKEPIADELRIGNLTLNYDLGFAKLVSATSYTDRDQDFTANTEYLLQAFFLPGPQRFAGNGSTDNLIRSFTQEVRLSSVQHGAWRWSAGAYYEHTTRRNSQVTKTDGFDSLFGASIGEPNYSSLDWGGTMPDTWYYGLHQFSEDQLAAFGELTYQPVEKLELTAGLRGFNWRHHFTSYNGGAAGATGPNEPLSVDQRAKEEGVNPRFVASYRVTPDVMLFAEAARGFRYGGANPPVPQSFCGASLAAEGLTRSPPTFGPDHLWSYSLGEKATLADGRARLNGAVFLVDWSDVQTRHALACSYPYYENAGRIRSTGAELEATMKVLPQLTLGLNGSYTHAVANGDIRNISARDGDRAPFSPQWMGAFNAEYVLGLSNQDHLRVRLDYQYHGSSGTRFDTSNRLYREIPSYSNVDLSVGYSADRWDVSLFARNMTNAYQVSLVQPNDLRTYPDDRYALLRPRTIGLRTAIRF